MITHTAHDALLPNYARAPITIVAGEGCELIDDTGRRYLDLIAGISVCALGHAHPAITRAVSEQAAKLVHASNLFFHEPSGELARELTRRSGLHRAFFCNSGTEANEAAIKLARKRAFRNGQTERNVIVSCSGSFHGRTFGALCATANAAYREGFGPFPDGFAFTPFNDIEALASALHDRVAAFIVEPVQGESGVHPADPAFLAKARELCDEHGALLIFDEVQCGMGRLGPLFAFQHFGVVPDIVTMAKALANGLPIGAMLVSETASNGFLPGDHGSTFGGSPLSAAAALAHLHERDRIDLEQHVKKSSAYLKQRLHALAERHLEAIAEVRGIGLLQGVALRHPFDAASIVAALRNRGILLGTAGANTLRFAPPLIISESQLDDALTALEVTLSA